MVTKALSIVIRILIFASMVGNGIVRSSAMSAALNQDNAPDNLQDVATIDPAKVKLNFVTSGLVHPIAIVNAGDGSGRIFIAEKSGVIRILSNGILNATPFLDMHTIVNSSSSEQGLLALVFHPQFKTNGYFYTVHTDGSGSLVLSRFSVSPSTSNQANFNSRVELLSIPHPTYTNHNGGTLLFGADGYLYWSTGDGGGVGDPSNNAQNLNSLLGKILRLDVDSALPYAIPATNPFYNSLNTSIRKEIWAYGLRNPWRISFDRLTHSLYIADVGQSSREEIDYQPANDPGGENYGWNIMEGTLCYNPPNGCDQSGKVLPIAEYDHTLGCSVTGGYVYRGSNFQSLYGYYFYGDYCSGRLFGLSLGSPPVQLVDSPYNISTFGEDENGELYLADYSGGNIYKIAYQESSYIISGNTGAGGVTLSYTDDIPKTVVSQADGSYSFQVPPGWSGTVTPSNACYAFDPPQRSYSNLDTSKNNQDYIPIFPSSADVHVQIGGLETGSYQIPHQDSTRQNYAGIDGGPIKVTSANCVPIVASLRDLWWNGSAYTSSTQLMGLPEAWLSDTYIFPSYNNASLNDQLRFGNVGNIATTVTVIIAGQVMGSYNLAPNQREKASYPGVDNGPIVVQSSNGVPIIASIRDAWINNGVTSSFSQLMGLPENLLSDTYLFPSYNNVSLSDQLRFSNVGSATTTVTVTIGGVVRGTYNLQPNERQKVEYAGLDSGPVVVHSSNAVPIIASLREAWLNNGVTTSYFQMMGLPQSQLSDKYVFPAYDNVTLSGQLRFGNVGNTNTTITVTIGGVVKGTYPLAPNQREKVSYAGLNDGPVVVQSSNGVPIIASVRDAWLMNGVTSSFSQLMGLPSGQLSTRYVFPSYNNVTYDNQVRIGVP